MEDGDATRSHLDASDATSAQLREALQDLKRASALISLIINDELAGAKHPATLERLYSAKGGITCAIEETEKHLSIANC